MLFYVYYAKRYNIVDKPNERSSHTNQVVRGAGIVFPISLIVFKVTYSQYYPAFHFIFAGAMLISLVSFIDDIRPLPISLRLPVHIISVAFLLYGFNIFEVWNWWSWIIITFIVLGIINSYNFMDGINGITALYSFVAFCTFWYVIKYTENIEATAFVNYGIVSCLVFMYFNFRKQAICFLGDVGSIGLGFWVVAALCYVVFANYQFEYFLFISVYLIDAGFTFIQRLLNGENVFHPHRKHLYQLLVNEMGYSHLTIATTYALVQLAVNFFVIGTNIPIVPTVMCVLVPLSLIYIFSKRYIIRHKKALAKKSK
jgi:UDP-N-acetylmuramyl pentapeptide phosphotransferase/UDP-N-acetylglucosamine-1-phosphate transferase